MQLLNNPTSLSVSSSSTAYPLSFRKTSKLPEREVLTWVIRISLSPGVRLHRVWYNRNREAYPFETTGFGKSNGTATEKSAVVEQLPSKSNSENGNRRYVTGDMMTASR